MIKIYIAVICLTAVILTVYDKLAAKKLPRHRIPERVLMLLGFLGGALPEYITMKLIRHKTRHKSFMICLPLFTVLHIVIIIAFYLLEF